MSARAISSRPNRSRSTQEEVAPVWHDAVTGLLFLFVALFCLLALISYDPKDVPSWCAGIALSDTTSETAHNLIGRLGAIMAGYSIWIFGAATYLVPACLTWFGVCKLVSHVKVTPRAWVGFGLVILCGAAILYLQTIWDWRDKNVSPYGAGGGLGHVLGGLLLVGIFGEVGSLLILSVGYAIGFIFVTGTHPLEVLMSMKRLVVRVISNWWAERQLRKAMAAHEEAKAMLPPEPPPKTKRKRGAEGDEPVMPVAEKFVATELPLEFKPQPKIVDASAPRQKKEKPQLQEVWQKREAQKQERVAFAEPQSLTARFKDYVMPPLEMLSWPDVKDRTPADENALLDMQQKIISCLGTFGIKVTAGDITKGPAITRYEVYPSEGLSVKRITNLEADIARATKAERLNILAPIPGKDTVGLELANTDKIVVPIRELLEDDAFQNGKAKIPIALGKDVYGKAIIADLADMPHLLVAGATGSGKSVCINSIITSLLYRFAPDEMRFIMIDPKVVEMQGYKDLPHLALPVVTDPKQALLALRWVVNEMEHRYQIFANQGCRNFDSFNARTNRKPNALAAKRSTTPLKDRVEPASGDFVVDFSGKATGFSEPIPAEEPETEVCEDGSTIEVSTSVWGGDSQAPARPAPELVIPDTIPYVVVIVDELADLMQTAPADIELAICRIAQKARAAGIHLIVATQSPRADVVTGIIKANIPCRIAFQVSSALDSRVIMDRKGADKLVGKGDMLYLPPRTSQLIRAQGTMVTDSEIEHLVEHCCKGGKPMFEAKLEEEFSEDDDGDGDEVTPEDEALLERVLDVLRAEKRASTSLIQRRLRLGYTRAARMMDILEERGIIGPGDGAKPREILVELD